MKLIYRGVSYESAPSATSNPSIHQRDHQPYNLTYRGIAYTVDPTQTTTSHSALSHATLLYRGVAYAQNGGTVVDRAVKSSAKALSAIHHDNLYRNVQHRLQIAQAQGNQPLVQLLEQELRKIA